MKTRVRGWLLVGALSVAVGIAAVNSLGSGAATAGGGVPADLNKCHQEIVNGAWGPMQATGGIDPGICAQVDHSKPHPMWGPGPTGFLTNGQGLVRLFLDRATPVPGYAAAAQPNPALTSGDPLVRQNAIAAESVASGQAVEVAPISLADLKASLKAGKGY